MSDPITYWRTRKNLPKIHSIRQAAARLKHYPSGVALIDGGARDVDLLSSHGIQDVRAKLVVADAANPSTTQSHPGYRDSERRLGATASHREGRGVSEAYRAHCIQGDHRLAECHGIQLCGQFSVPQRSTVRTSSGLRMALSSTT